MKITCPACDAEYNVDPSRVPATGLNMRCPKCSHSFRVTADGQTEAAGNAGGNTILDGGGHAMSGERFYIKRSTGKVFGPFDRSAIQQMLKSNKLDTNSEVSTDKANWQSILEIPAFSQFVSDKPLPSMPAKNPRATMMGGWAQQEGGEAGLPAVKGPADLPAAKRSGPPALPVPKSNGAPGLPVPKSSGGPGLPVPKQAADLPRAKAEPGLPAPKNGPGLPTPKAPGLPTPKGEGLPVPKADADLPRPRDADLPTSVHSRSAGLPIPKPPDEDIFGDGASVDAGDDLFGGDAGESDLFGAPLGGGDDDDLFGPEPSAGDDLFGDSAAPDDDLFGAPQQPADDDDLFGAPQQPADDDDLFSAPAAPAEDEDLFAAPAGGGESDLFGHSEPDDDDLFAAPKSSDDDFLGGDGGFSFLDDQPEPEPMDNWGDDLFGSEASEASEASDAWGEDLLDQPARPAAPSGPVLADDDPFRPASSGLQHEEAPSANVSKEATVQDDRRRSPLIWVAVPVVAIVLGGGAWFVASNFMSDDGTHKTHKAHVAGPVKVGVAMVKSDNYSDYAVLGDKGARPKPSDYGKWLLAESMRLVRYPDSKAEAEGAAIAKKLDKAKTGFDALGRGAWEAHAGNADAARAYLEPLSTKDGDIGFLANLVMGVGDVQEVEAEAKAHPPADTTPAPKPLPTPPAAKNGTNNAAPDSTNGDQATTNGAKTSEGAGTNGKVADEKATATNNAPAPPKVPTYHGLVDRARKAFAAASKLDPKSPLPYYWEGHLDRLITDRKAAQKALKKAVELGPKHVASNLELGELDYERGDLNDAIELLEKVSGELSAQASNSEKAAALHYAGLVHVARSQSDLAIESFTKALSIDSSRADTLRALAEEYERAHKYKEALNFFTTNKNLGQKDPEVMLGIVRSHIGLEQWNEAIATLEQGEKQFPNDAQFPYYLGQLYMKRGEFADAQKPLKRAVKINPKLLLAQATLAQLAWRMDKDIEQGEQYISHIVANPGKIDADVATQVAKYYAMSGRRNTAEGWYREALRRNPNHWPARLALSKLLLEEGKQAQARKLLEQARKEGVQDVRLSAYLADAYRQAKDYDRAIDEINKVIEAFPKNEKYVFIRGRIQFDRGNYKNAQSDFQKAYDLNPRYQDAYFFVGRTEFAQGNYSNALKIFRHVLDYKPNRGNYHFFMARALEAEHRQTQALDEYRKATAVDPAYGIENPMVYVYRGRLLSKLGYVQQGKADIARALELAPGNVDALLAMGSAEYDDREYNDAIKHYTKALKVDPSRSEAQYHLGMAYLYTNHRAEAAQHLQLAIKNGAEKPEIYKRLGYVYRDMGQRSQAINAFKLFLEKAEAQGNVPDGTKREVLHQIEALK